jgi:hypothetical protein
MADHPILFSTPMVQGILAGQKTETRRLARGSRINTGCEDDRPIYRASPWQRVKAGDRLWVREALETPTSDQTWRRQYHYVADGLPTQLFSTKDRPNKRPGIHMPRRCSRLTLIVNAVRIEPLQAITEAGAIAEGITGAGRDWRAGAMAQGTDPIAAYHALWWALNGIESWNQNPEVVVISFTAIQGNIDRLAA